jgi:hypothetical protein
MDTVIFRRVAEAANDSEPKNCFLFVVETSSESDTEIKLFRDPVGIEVLMKVADTLRTSGFGVSEPRPGKTWDAAFRISFSEFFIGVTLITEREGKVVDCLVVTSCRKRILHRVSPELVRDRWKSVCDAIEKALEHDPDVQSLRRVTRKQGMEAPQESSEPTRYRISKDD